MASEPAGSRVPTLSQWLQVMLAEIAAKREALERARAEEALRSAESTEPRADSRGGASQR